MNEYMQLYEVENLLGLDNQATMTWESVLTKTHAISFEGALVLDIRRRG
jgi:hypothetical protein